MNTIEKTLRILELLSRSSEGIKFSDIALDLNASLPSTYHYTKTLMNQGYAVKDGMSNKIYPTFKCSMLGISFLQNNQLIKKTTVFLDQLSEALRSSVHLSINKRNVGICINKVDYKHVHSSITHVGSEFDLYPTALGRAMLAFFNEKKLDEYLEMITLKAYTIKTVTSKEELRKILKEVKKKKYAMDYEEHKLGLCSMGVPVFNHLNQVVAALSTIIPFNCSEEEKNKIFCSLQKYSKILETEFGSILSVMKIS